MPRALRISPPRPVRPKDLLSLESFDLKRASTIPSAYSNVSSTSSYEDFRREEKTRNQAHASGGTWIELFYDLFFAASLSAFSRTREISGQKDLIDLAAFFTILWWTWASQTLFDVRHAKHNKFEKTLKLMQILIMVGYGVFEGDFSLFINTHVEPRTNTKLRSMVSQRRKSASKISTIAISSLFILSRFQLAAQYFRVALRRRTSQGRMRKSHLIASALPVVASSFWLASFLVIDSTIVAHGFYAARSSLWLAGILVEVMGTFVLRLHKKPGFTNTHLTERFGSLTIVIIGEGVIKLVTVLRDISAGVGFEIKSAVAVTAAILSFYLIWAIYFDDFNLHEGIGSAGYKWAYMHYLFHLAVVLALDGVTSLLLFTNIFGGMKSLLNPQRETDMIEDLLNLQNTSLATTGPTTLGKITFVYNTQNGIMSSSSVNGTELSQSQYDYVFIHLFEAIFKSYNVEPSGTFFDFLGALDPSTLDEHQVSRAFHYLLAQFIVSAQFFLLACGMIFMTSIPIMIWQGRLQPMNASRWYPISSRLFFGLLFLALAGLTDSEGKRLGKMLMSGVMIPGFMAASMLIYSLDRITMRYLQFHN